MDRLRHGRTIATSTAQADLVNIARGSLLQDTMNGTNEVENRLCLHSLHV